MYLFEKKILSDLSGELKNYDIQFFQPPSMKEGHISIPCFKMAGQLKKPPGDIAGEIGTIIESLDYIDKTEVKGGYLNCFIKTDNLFDQIIRDVLTKGQTYGSLNTGVRQKLLIEHTSINPNASPHVGRARNAMIGNAVTRLLKFEGYETEVHYFVNDIGKQIAMLMLGVEDPATVSFEDLLDLYIDMNHKLDDDPNLEDQVFKLLYELENGNKEVKKGFRELVNVCIDGQTTILKELGITYDCFDYESDYLFDETLKSILNRFEETGRLEEDEEGRLCLNLEGYALPMRSPYLVLTRKDKTSLYPLRDIAYTLDKAMKNPDRNLIVLGEDQILYHKQICAALDLLGVKAPESIHYAFVLLAEGKMATRKGRVVLLEDFMDQAYKKAYLEIEKRYDEVSESVAKAIGYSAVKYAILKTSNEKNVTFDWDKALSFEGDSGPYLQYTLARVFSIENKCKSEKVEIMSKLNSLEYVDVSLLGQADEVELIMEVGRMYDVIDSATKSLSPHFLANYLFSLAQKFSKFYHSHSVINAGNDDLIMARMALIQAVKQAMINGFEILGLDVIEKM